jgi:hypothetical protein
VDSYTSEDRCIDNIHDDEQRRPWKEVVLTPTALSTTVRHIYDRVPNSMNSKLFEDFHCYLKGCATSERYQNSNLKAANAYTEFLGKETTFYQISTKEQVTKFFDTKIRSNSDDPERRWITTRKSNMDGFELYTSRNGR